jgi:hypothetical protein
MLRSALALCALLSASASGAHAASPPAQTPVYSVAQLMRDPGRFAHQPSGQWLLVRGVVWGCDADLEIPGRRCMSLRPLIVDPATGAHLPVVLSQDRDACPLQHVRWGRLATYCARVVHVAFTGGYAVDLPDTDAARIYEHGRG